MALAASTVLDRHYEIVRPLDVSPPYTLVYKAKEIDTGAPVCIQEYFPEALAERDEATGVVRPQGDSKKAALFQAGMSYFRKEAGVLGTIAHARLEREQAPFTDNGTLYRVRAAHNGPSLAHVIEQKGALALRSALTAVVPVLNGLQAAHERGLIHGGVAPMSIRLRTTKGAVLTNFYSAALQLARRCNQLDEIAQPGCSAPELYAEDGAQGPWTDVYGAAATLTWALTGTRPPGAHERQSTDPLTDQIQSLDAISDRMKEVLGKGLALDPSDRFRSVTAFQEALQEALEPLESSEDQLGEQPEAQVEPADEAAAPEGGEAPPDAPLQEPSTDAHFPKEPDVELTEDTEAPPAEEQPLDAEQVISAMAQMDQRATDAPDEQIAAEEEAEPDEEAPPEGASRPADREDAEEKGAEAETESPTPPASSQEDADTGMPPGPPVTDRPGPAAQEDEGPMEPISEPAKEGRLEADRSPNPAEDMESDGAEASPGVGHEDATHPPRKRRRSAIGAAALLVVIAALGIWLWPSGGGSDAYATYRAQADSLFARADYAEAKSLYKQVLDARPNDEYASERLQRIDAVQANRQQEQFVRHLSAGDSLSARADSLLQAQSAEAAAAHYREAQQAYASALEVRPGDADALARQQSIRGLLESMGESAPSDDDELDTGQLFTLYRAQGDEAFEAGDYAKAERKYQEALGYRPDSVAVRNQLQAVRAQMEQQENEARYAALIQQADSLFADQQYTEAQAQYRQALALVPEDSNAAARVATIDSLITAREERNDTYQYHRGRGDVYFDQGDYRAAIDSYRQALDVRPEDRYVLDRISESWSAMEAARRSGDQSAPTSARRDTTSG